MPSVLELRRHLAYPAMYEPHRHHNIEATENAVGRSRRAAPESALSTVAREALRLMRARQWTGALQSIDRALALNTRDAALQMYRAQCLMALGQRGAAFAAAEEAQRCGASNAAIADAAGTLFSLGNDQRRALAAYDRAVALAPRNARFIYNRATVRRFLGLLAEAESDYDRVIALEPKDFEAYKNRADLRTQTATRNHVAELESLASSPFTDWRAEVQIRYALAKEHEDLGNYARSFEHLTLGAQQRRRHLHYDIATDLATGQWIMDAYPAGPAAVAAAQCEEAPVFIVGLPRSGTTLVERILGSHTALHPAGELDCFALAIVDAVRRRTGAAQVPRRELVATSATVDFAALGLDYLRRVRALVPGAGRFVDKMPLNYLYCGLIRRALPHAKIVHVTRGPMAVCYAMYKALFKDGYPFSYDLEEIGRYYIAYRRLMTHWRDTMPGALYELSYESLVADQLSETRKLLAFCGLDWQDGCAQFQENATASTTASAAQIRRPIYESSVSLWRHYARELEGVGHQLQAAGIAIG